MGKSTKPNKPGLFAPAGEKALHAEVFGKQRAAEIEQIGMSHAEYRPIASAVSGLLAYAGKDYERAERCLGFAFNAGIEPTDDSFFKKYMNATEVSLEIAPGVTAELPMSREAIGLALAEIGQGTGRLDLAIDTVEQLDPTYTAAISLAELYSDAGRHDDVVKLTDGTANADDQSAFLLMLRAVALRELGMPDASKEAFKEALKRRSTDPAIRHRALLERAILNAQQGKKALARKDLERVIADDSTYPGIADLLAALD
ncbi:lipopolysaccharide assembly protein LapB [Blastococcus sp. Marseille-P5729]|uniref:tetratricopeptide repeat protein n=1 Tax=Blastococcus sp. Marseille-P5729 TaxID=2086582 RepID=UPI001F1D800C|nr:hypothetical protein [Blastococcus sp. Marseille-P5729]